MTITVPNIRANWKSTVQSSLTTTFAITGALMVSSAIKPQTAAVLIVINSVAKVALGLFQSDGLVISPEAPKSA